jgi:hypothetical protein
LELKNSIFRPRVFQVGFQNKHENFSELPSAELTSSHQLPLSAFEQITGFFSVQMTDVDSLSWIQSADLRPYSLPVDSIEHRLQNTGSML